MAVTVKAARLGKATPTNLQEVASRVGDILADIGLNGDAAVRKYSEQFDEWSPEKFRLSDEVINRRLGSLPEQTIEAISFARDQIKSFAELQLTAVIDVETETMPGVRLGHRNYPVESAGCYVPSGRYPLIASALMGIVTARVAGVKRVAAACPPFHGAPHPAVLAAMKIAGADEIYCIGGVQAIGALGLGTPSIPAVDMIVGPGNVYVAEAKRQLFGRVGIDLVAGPTEMLLIADESADAELCAVDLLGQAEHGVDSPVVLLTNSMKLAQDVVVEIERQLSTLPTADIARAAWMDRGEVIFCADPEEMAAESERLAFEHVHVVTRDTEFFRQRLRNYGSLFLGERVNVAFGDKVIGTNHTLPTRGGARFTGGLWVGSFIKTCTYQSVDSDQACALLAKHCATICELEGFPGHKRQADLRLRRFAGNEAMG